MPLENTLADVSITFGVTMLPHLRDFTVLGPSMSPACRTRPAAEDLHVPADHAAEEESCAAEIVKKLTTQAFRGRRLRPICRTR